VPDLLHELEVERLSGGRIEFKEHWLNCTTDSVQ
jgi:hypothetical protein